MCPFFTVNSLGFGFGQATLHTTNTPQTDEVKSSLMLNIRRLRTASSRGKLTT